MLAINIVLKSESVVASFTHKFDRREYFALYLFLEAAPQSRFDFAFGYFSFADELAELAALFECEFRFNLYGCVRRAVEARFYRVFFASIWQ